MNQPNVKIGLEVFLEQPPQVLRGVRIGLLLNQASLDSNLKLSCDAIADRFPGQRKCLFSPQHGIWGEQPPDHSKLLAHPLLTLGNGFQHLSCLVYKVCVFCQLGFNPLLTNFQSNRARD